MYKNLGQIKTEMNKLEKQYVNDLLTKEEYISKLEYLKEWAKHFEHEKRKYKTK